jgi:hypothetical protein
MRGCSEITPDVFEGPFKKERFFRDARLKYNRFVHASHFDQLWNIILLK